MSSDAEELSLDSFLKQADIARQRQAWDDVIKIYQVALKQAPEDRRFRFGLAQAYSAKADQSGFKAMHQRALEEFWRLVNGDPSDVKAHDGLLATAVKADQLADVMEEYRQRMTRLPENSFYKDAFKKIQTLYFLRAEPTKVTAASGGFLNVFAGRLAPLGALGCLLAWVFVRMKIGPNAETAGRTLLLLESVLGRLGFFLILGSLAYYAYRIFRTRK